MLELKNVSKYYYKKGMITTGFSKVNLKFDMGEFVAITGESGSGKSTLLNVISGLDTYEDGEMYINGEETSYYTEKDYENYRKKYIGNIFQNFNLVNSYTVYQNIELVFLLNGYNSKDVKEKILDLIEEVGLTKLKNKKASKLSGGQKQRVAIARALASDTPIILADEPTGNLDKASAMKVLEILHDISKDKLVIVVTHNYDQIENYVTRKISMADGKVIEDKKIKDYDKVKNVKLFESKKMNILSKIKIGFRNAFNILSKTLLIGFVYLFIVFSLFTVYTTFQGSNSLLSSEAYNSFFSTNFTNRIVLKKSDSSLISEDEINTLKNISNVKEVVKSDLILDSYVSFSTDKYYAGGNAKNSSELKEVDFGRLPENYNEFVWECNPSWEGPIDEEEFTELTKEIFKLYNSDIEYKLVGVKYNEDYDNYVYLNEEGLVEINKEFLLEKTTLKYTFLKQEYTSEIGSKYYSIVPSTKVPNGKVVIPSDYEYYCKNFNCTNNNLTITSSTIYNTRETTLKVYKTYYDKNFTKLTGYKFNDYTSCIFVNNEDYNNLFDNSTYQLSLLIDDKYSTEIKAELDKANYKYVYIKDTISDTNNNEIIRILNIVKLLVNIGLVVGLFFISYFIIKLVLRSRNIYYSTLRILGCTYNDTKKLLNIELFVLANLAYLIFILLIYLSNNNYINSEYISGLAEYMEFKHYIMIYIVIAFMTFLTTERYSRKLFVDSVMNTYRDEV